MCALVYLNKFFPYFLLAWIKPTDMVFLLLNCINTTMGLFFNARFIGPPPCFCWDLLNVGIMGIRGCWWNMEFVFLFTLHYSFLWDVFNAHSSLFPTTSVCLLAAETVFNLNLFYLTITYSESPQDLRARPNLDRHIILIYLWGNFFKNPKFLFCNCV